MKVLLLSTSVFPLPPTGYAGVEQIVYALAVGLNAKGHQVAVAAPEGSQLPQGVELIPLTLRAPEQLAFEQYKDHLTDFDVIHDHTFEAWSYIASRGISPPLPIIKTHHTDPSIWSSAPPVLYPNLVGLSRNHARRLALAYGVPVEYVHNGVDLDFYKMPEGERSDGVDGSGGIQKKERNSRLLHIGRYSPEKGVLEAIQVASELKMPLDIYGDMEIISQRDYPDRCRRRADGVLVRCNGGVPREKTVELYQGYKALLLTPNWDEPFGLVTAEAAACGMPVLCLGRGALPELVKDGETGYVCDDLDDIREVLKEGCLSSIDPQRCRQWAEERFSYDDMVDGYVSLYQKVAAGKCW